MTDTLALALAYDGFDAVMMRTDLTKNEVLGLVAAIDFYRLCIMEDLIAEGASIIDAQGDANLFALKYENVPNADLKAAMQMSATGVNAPHDYLSLQYSALYDLVAKKALKNITKSFIARLALSRLRTH